MRGCSWDHVIILEHGFRERRAQFLTVQIKPYIHTIIQSAALLIKCTLHLIVEIRQLKQ